jgi:hypothetical protein
VPRRLNLVNRKLHYWASATVAVPLLVIISTGLLLQLKKQWSWVQPSEQRGTGTAPVVDLERILASVRTVPDSASGAGKTSTAWTSVPERVW